MVTIPTRLYHITNFYYHRGGGQSTGMAPTDPIVYGPIVLTVAFYSTDPTTNPYAHSF
jgi:hypothetical protein